MGDLLSPAPLMGSVPSDHPPQPFWEYPDEPSCRDGHGCTARPHCCTFGELPKLSHCQEWLHQQGLGLGSGKSGAAGLAGAAAGPQGIQVFSAPLPSSTPSVSGMGATGQGVRSAPWPHPWKALWRRGRKSPSTCRACSGAAPAGGTQLSSGAAEPGAKGSARGHCLTQHHTGSV